MATSRPPRALPAIALTIINSLVQLLGVLVWNWPIGNIFLLLWIENVIITMVAVVRIARVRTPPGAAPEGGRVSVSLGMGVFCLVHGIFSVVLAFMTGMDLSPAQFLFPLIVLIVRYSVEGVGDLARGQQPRTIAQANGFATRRIVMLHIVIIACWFVMIFSLVGPTLSGPGLPGNPAVLALVILLVIKTGAEVVALARGRDAESSWRFTFEWD